MKKTKTMPLSIAITVLVLMLVVFLVQTNFHRPESIVLPPEQSVQEPEGGTAGEESVHRVSVRPDTVQTAIATLTRSQSYSRTILVERFWEDGSGTQTTTVNAKNGWLRIDTTLPNGDTRHVICGDGVGYIWYNSERLYYEAADVIGEDAEQGILTYEDILLLDTECIVLADYRAFGDLNCIYVETSEDEDGYLERYWVDVASGLLVAAEVEQRGMPVYRMDGTVFSSMEVTADMFTLPDGTVLQTMVNAA